MLSIRTLVLYLLGGAGAARRIASHPKALWVGLVFVLAAGFAREYDGEDLLRAPWHLALPVVASVIQSLLLYLTLRVAALPGQISLGGAADAQPQSGYPVLLRLVWFTAPLAFLYAIPVERMMGAGDAASANLWLLALVAAWRVILITRAIAVTWRTRFGAVLFPVMLFSDGLALLLVVVAPLPTLSLMGGVRLTESEQVIRSTADWVMLLAILSGPLWLIGTVIASHWLRKAGMAGDESESGSEPAGARVSKPLIALAALSLLMWIPILPATQPPQQRRRDVEEDLRAGRLAEAVARVRGWESRAFPPHWDPPPRQGYGERKPNPITVLAIALEDGAPYWFVAAYVEKIPNALGLNSLYETREFRSSDERLQCQRAMAALLRSPHAKRLAQEHNGVLRAVIERLLGDNPLPPPWRDLLGEPRAR